MDWYVERNKKIYSAYKEGIPKAEIAQKWGLDRDTINLIIKNAENGNWHYRKLIRNYIQDKKEV